MPQFSIAQYSSALCGTVQSTLCVVSTPRKESWRGLEGVLKGSSMGLHWRVYLAAHPSPPIQTHAHIHKNTHTRAHTHTNTHTHTHAHTHTHTPCTSPYSLQCIFFIDNTADMHPPFNQNAQLSPSIWPSTPPIPYLTDVYRKVHTSICM